LGAMVGYIGGKDGRTTGNMSLPVYKGMLAKTRTEKPKLSKEEEKKKKDYLMKMYGGGGDGEEKKKKKKRKVRKDGSSAVTIIDHDEGLGGIALATARGAKNMSDEEMSDEQAVVVEEEEIRAREEEENKISSVQVGDGGSSGQNWVQVDEDGNIVEKKKPAGDARDLSPPRRGKRSRHDSDSDQSPPRKRPGVKEEDQSPPRRRRHDSDDDQSPPRRKAQDQSPPRRKAGGGRHDSDSDQSPPRKRAGAGGGGTRHDSDSDQSPPRRKGGADQSPPRRGGGTRHDSDSDQSPPRSRAVKEEPNARTVNGLRAGFVSGTELSDTMRKKKEAEDARFKQLEDKDTGRVAATVYRDKKGQRVQDGEGGKKKELDKDETELANMVWGKGLVQLEERAALEKQIQDEKSKPFARRADDKDMNEQLKEVTRWGDPMAARLAKKSSAKPKYNGPYPPNRFGIPPGFRWDGVDRSNGFERQYFAAQNTRKTNDLEATAWATEQM